MGSSISTLTVETDSYSELIEKYLGNIQDKFHTYLRRNRNNLYYFLRSFSYEIDYIGRFSYINEKVTSMDFLGMCGRCNCFSLYVLMKCIDNKLNYTEMLVEFIPCDAFVDRMKIYSTTVSVPKKLLPSFPRPLPSYSREKVAFNPLRMRVHAINIIKYSRKYVDGAIVIQIDKSEKFPKEDFYLSRKIKTDKIEFYKFNSLLVQKCNITKNREVKLNAVVYESEIICSFNDIFSTEWDLYNKSNCVIAIKDKNHFVMDCHVPYDEREYYVEEFKKSAVSFFTNIIQRFNDDELTTMLIKLLKSICSNNRKMIPKTDIVVDGMSECLLLEEARIIVETIKILENNLDRMETSTLNILPILILRSVVYEYTFLLLRENLLII